MSNDEKSTAVALRVPIAVQTRAAAVSIEAADAMMPAITAMWPADVKSNPALGRLVARIAVAYGLDPLMNEVTIYQGKPYITIDGRLRKAQEHEQYRGLECRPATEEERKNYRAVDDDHLWRAEVYRKDWPKAVVGWGLVRKGDRNVVAQSTPQLMAEKRAKARALRDAFSIPLPSAEDAEDYTPAPSRYVNSTTGELTDTRPGGMLASRGQISAIHVLEKQLESDAEQRHQRFVGMFDKVATNELTEGEAAAYLEWLASALEARENQRPEVIEAKRRDETPLTVPKAASKRFHTRQEPTDVVLPTGRVFISAEQIEADRDAEDAEPEPAVDAEVVEDAPEADHGTPLADMPERLRAPLAAAAMAIGQTPEPDWSPGKVAQEWAKLLRSFGIKKVSEINAQAIIAALHLAQTGEEISIDTAPDHVTGGEIIWLANNAAQWPILREVAEWMRIGEE